MNNILKTEVIVDVGNNKVTYYNNNHCFKNIYCTYSKRCVWSYSHYCWL